MTKVELEQLKELLKDRNLANNFGMFCRVYNMTTENIFGFLNNYDLKDKKVLTVAGSGDQRLNSYLLGAKDVTCFDINPLTELNMELKDRALETLCLDEFLDFFGIVNGYYDENSVLDFRLFDKFSILLDSDTYDFYNYVIQNNKGKDIYFDITDFFDGASVPNNKNVSEYAAAKRNIINYLTECAVVHKEEETVDVDKNLKEMVSKYNDILTDDEKSLIEQVSMTTDKEKFFNDKKREVLETLYETKKNSTDKEKINEVIESIEKRQFNAKELLKDVAEFIEITNIIKAD